MQRQPFVSTKCFLFALNRTRDIDPVIPPMAYVVHPGVAEIGLRYGAASKVRHHVIR